MKLFKIVDEGEMFTDALFCVKYYFPCKASNVTFLMLAINLFGISTRIEYSKNCNFDNWFKFKCFNYKKAELKQKQKTEEWNEYIDKKYKLTG